MGVDKHYRVEWEKEDMFKGWLCKAPEDLISSGHGEAYCKWCKVSLCAQKHDLKVHCSREIHQMQYKAKNLDSGEQENLTDTGLQLDMSDEESNGSSRSSESTPKRSKSKFEEFFEIIHASQIAICKLCQHKKVKIKMKNRNTSGLRKHLTSYHKEESQIFLSGKPKISRNFIGILTRAEKSAQDSNKIYISDKHKSQKLPKNPKRYSCDKDQQAQNVIVENFKQLQHKHENDQREKFSSSNNVVHLTSISDDYQKKDEHYYWVMACASDLRNMEKTQQIYAKKAIAEIIMEGQLGTLGRDSVKINKRLDNNSIVLKIGSPLPEYERDGLQNDQD